MQGNRGLNTIRIKGRNLEPRAVATSVETPYHHAALPADSLCFTDSFAGRPSVHIKDTNIRTYIQIGIPEWYSSLAGER